ncbi:MAG: F0F1 ATP synthase subunit epsilon [Anaerolineae bacterium]|nr:MAG: F0F1 ATP synthase subunit epsilon [Anaerolineae bacterium]
METIRCEIVTVERLVYEDDVDSVTAPAVMGEIQVLPHHAPLITALDPGELVVEKGGEAEYFAIGGGYLEVLTNKVTIMADTAEYSDEIDEARAQEAQERAERFLREHPPTAEDYAAIEGALRRSLVRLRVARRKRRRRAVPFREETRD